LPRPAAFAYIPDRLRTQDGSAVMSKKLLGIGILLVGLLAVGVYVSRTWLQAYYYVHELEVAVEESSVPYSAITELGPPAVGRLIDLLRRDHSPHVRVGKALSEIVAVLPENDPRLA